MSFHLSSFPPIADLFMISAGILEVKLDSAPELAAAVDGAQGGGTTATAVENMQTEDVERKENEEEAPVEATESAVPQLTVADDPRYTKYFKMLKMGVPMQVK